MVKLVLCVLLLVVAVHAVAAYSVPYPYRPFPYRPYPCRPCPNTCRNAICPRYRSAICRVQPCTCQRRWYLRTSYYGRIFYIDVTFQCSRPPFIPYPFRRPMINPAPVVHYLPMRPMPSPNTTETPEEPMMTTENPAPSPAPSPASSPRPVEIESAAACSSLTCDAGICKIDSATGMPYCEPSCKVNNGGCRADEECLMRNVHCTRAPCPPVVECVVAAE